jgi:putative endonuclease
MLCSLNVPHLPAREPAQGTIYCGSTDELLTRVAHHKAKRFSGFTAKYGVDRLVWFESHPSRDQAFLRERRIKEWRRLWKIQLIEARNPNWLDLFPDLDRLLAEDEMRGPRPWLAHTIPNLPLIGSGHDRASRHVPNPLIPAKAGTQAGDT